MLGHTTSVVVDFAHRKTLDSCARRWRTDHSFGPIKNVRERLRLRIVDFRCSCSKTAREAPDAAHPVSLAPPADLAPRLRRAPKSLESTDSERQSSKNGALLYPSFIYDESGAIVMQTPDPGAWIFRGFLKTGDTRFRRLVKRFADAGFLAEEKDDFTAKQPVRRSASGGHESKC